jgi:hypothetical protein
MTDPDYLFPDDAPDLDPWGMSVAVLQKHSGPGSHPGTSSSQDEHGNWADGTATPYGRNPRTNANDRPRGTQPAPTSPAAQTPGRGAGQSPTPSAMTPETTAPAPPQAKALAVFDPTTNSITLDEPAIEADFANGLPYLQGLEGPHSEEKANVLAQLGTDADTLYTWMQETGGGVDAYKALIY